MENKNKILVIGSKCHGKTTFSHFLRDALGSADAYSTSAYLVYRLSLIEGVSEKEILTEKEKYRPQLVTLGNGMCDVDAGCLVSICLWASSKDTVIIDGVRRISEFSRVKGWFDRVIWIERPSEPLGMDNLELSAEHADEVIENSGTLEDLQEKARLLAAQIKG